MYHHVRAHIVKSKILSGYNNVTTSETGEEEYDETYQRLHSRAAIC